MSSVLTIGEVARRSGVAASALRFYEERGLISSERVGSGHRRYPRPVLRRIAFIVFAQRIGLSLEEIAYPPDEELEERTNKPKTYIRGNQIGKTGIERIYEDDLRGTPGQTVFEVDAMGDPVRILGDLSTPPIPGDDVWLTIDIETQALSEDLLAQALEDARERRVSAGNLPNRGNAGSVVVTDPRNRATGTGVTRYVLLHGLAQHHAYHAGQIAILSKF